MQPETETRFCDGCGQSNRMAARFCAGCGSDLPARATETLAPLDQARRLCERSEPLRARAILEAALAEQPGDDRVRLLYATLLLQAADWENGLQNLEQLRVSAPWSPVVEAYIGGALLGLNRVSDAKDTLDAAIALAPNDFYLLLKRGEVYCRLGIYQTGYRRARTRFTDPGGRAGRTRSGPSIAALRPREKQRRFRTSTACTHDGFHIQVAMARCRAARRSNSH